MKKWVTFLLFLFLMISVSAQEELYLFGNLKGPKLSKRLKHFEATLDKEENKANFTLLLLGDLRQKNNENEDTLVSFIQRIQKRGAKVIAVTGDRDWDKSGLHGLDTVKALEHRFKTKIGHNIFFPKKNCPGPYVKDIGEDIRLIAINSQWWLHHYRKMLPVDSECDQITKVQILDDLTEAIETAKERKVIIITHHPITSGGVYGGNSHLKGHLFPFSHDKPNNKTFLPLYGTFYNKYRQNIGTTQDFSSDEYEAYISDIEGVLTDYEDVVVCSSHEYDLQVLKINNNFQIISGSFLKSAQVNSIKNTLYKNKSRGFVKVETTDNKELISKIYLYDKEANEFALVQTIPLHTSKHEHSINHLKLKSSSAELQKQEKYYGGDYGASKFKELFFGSLYRDAWTEHIDVPMLDLDTVFGGLTPLEKGGGLQTISLKFKDKDGRKYAFRSINKTPIKALPKEFRISLVNEITRDMTATQHPYGALFVSSLLNSTELYHGSPKLYIMPDSPKLGTYRKEFAGMFGMLEPKPTELDDLSKSFQNADQVKSTISLYNKLYDSPKNYIDTALYAKSRIFDILIGDWDRHQDNWKWIGFKKDSLNTVYKPYPKDRDHAFSRMNGIFYYLADREWAVPFRENFSKEFSGLKSLTIKANHMDRMMLSGLNKKEWLDISAELNAQITDATIDSAKAAFPKELQEKSGKEIAEKLKFRKNGLSKIVEEYYQLISKEVDVVGTNSAELFRVNRLPTGAVHVRVSKKQDSTYTFFDRVFDPAETDEIRLFGLAEADSFYVYGESYKSILVRIVGGTDLDVVRDESYSKIGSKRTLVYDYPDGVSLFKSSETRAIYTEEISLNEYDQTAHKYNTYLPIPLLVSNPDDGFGGGAILNAKTFGFGHKKYKAAYAIKAFATTNGSNSFSVSAKRNIARTNYFITSKLEYGSFFPFYNFFGVGNNTVLVDSLKDQGFYKARYSGAIATFGSTYHFYNKSYISLKGVVEILEEGHSDKSYFDYFSSPELQSKNAGGAELKIDFDFRNSSTFTTKGIRFILSNKSLISGSKAFGKTNVELSYYGTSTIGIPITFGLKLGTERTFGKSIPYYHLASIGQSNHLRGFLQNRFSGVGTNYINTDLRLHFGKLKSEFLPLFYGINLFADIGQVVQNNNFTEKKWHNGYGVGVYFTPINKDFVTLKINIETSVEQAALFKIGLGVLL